MSAPPRSSRGNYRAGQEVFTHIQLGMDVEDASGEPIGNVIYLRPGDPPAIDRSLEDASMTGEGLGEEAHHDPYVAPDVVPRMLQHGYFKFDARQRLQWDQHYYALADDVASIDQNTVRLGKSVGDLLATYD